MSEIGDLIKRLNAVPYTGQVQQALTDAVYELKAKEATDINNAGMEAQVVYLGVGAVEALLEDFEEGETEIEE